MKTSIEYRSYVVSHDGSDYTAVAADGEAFQMKSKNMLRITRAIDALWNALEGKIPSPSWLMTEAEVIDIDAASSEAMLIVDRPAVAPASKSAPVLSPVQAVA